MVHDEVLTEYDTRATAIAKMKWKMGVGELVGQCRDEESEKVMGTHERVDVAMRIDTRTTTTTCRC